LREEARLAWVSWPVLRGQLRSPLGELHAQQGFTAGVATCFDEAKKVCPIVVACFPLLSHIWQIRLKFVCASVSASCALYSFGEAGRGDITLDSVATEVKLASNLALGNSLPVQSHHLLIASEPLVPADQLLTLSRQHIREIGLWNGLWAKRCGRSRCARTSLFGIHRKEYPQSPASRCACDPGTAGDGLADVGGMGSRRGTPLLTPFFDPFPSNRTCTFQCIWLSNIIFYVKLTQAFVSSVFHRSHPGGM